MLLIVAFYCYAVFGSLVVIEDCSERHCYVANDSNVPLATLPESTSSTTEFHDGAQSSKYIATLGLVVLLV